MSTTCSMIRRSPAPNRRWFFSLSQFTSTSPRERRFRETDRAPPSGPLLRGRRLTETAGYCAAARIGEVLVKSDTIGISMPEVLVRKGVYAWMPPLPAIPGIELAGMIVEQGAGTTEPAIGQPVFVSARDLPVRAGCYAEYIAVPAHAAHPLPPGCSL